MYGLIGKKLGHSFSADFFNEKFIREGIDESYHLFPLQSIGELPGLIVSKPELKGLNVTIPYKEEVFEYLDAISPEARAIGAVNVIKIEDVTPLNCELKREGKQSLIKDKVLTGYNSDFLGYLDSIRPLLTPEFKKALILGTGGASKAVAHALATLGIDYVKVSRKPGENQLGYDDLDENIIKDRLLIVNATPLGTYPDINESPAIPYHFLTPRHLCYDLVYNPEETKFLFLSHQRGAMTKNGREMHHLQALGAWEIWNNSTF